MNAPLKGLRVIEVSAFVAAPLGGMTLAQLGAEVIRIDPLGGNIDYTRWPVAPSGESIYWAGLNKAKKSVTLALNTPEGQELATKLICAPGEGGGVLLTNLPSRGWMSYEALAKHRSDLIMLRLTGNYDGSGAVDYTVNSSSGFPIATGPNEHPVNHVLPAWDMAAGLYLALGLIAAERVRNQEGNGQEVSIALSDVMLAMVGNLGYIGDVQINGVSREPIGNDLYGALGRNYPTKDNREVMIVAISNRQWKALGQATGLAERFAMIGPLMDVDLFTEGGRFEARDAIGAVLRPWVAARTVAEIDAAFKDTGVLWGPYRTFKQLVEEDERCSTANPLFQDVDQPGIGRFLTPRIPLTFAQNQALPPTSAPRLGQDTDNVLQGMLGLSGGDMEALSKKGILAPKK